MINTESLRNKILDLAIQGKLTEQLPEDGNAEDLYAQIQQERQKLIADGKIKKEKAPPEIEEYEIPFEIPDNWKWVRLRTICTKIVDGDHNPPSGIKEKTDYLMLSAQNVDKNRLVDLDRARHLTKEVFEEEDKRTKLQEGDILLTIVGALGRSCVYQGGLNACFQRSVSVITTKAYNKYIKYVFDSRFTQKHINDGATGAAQLGFYLDKVGLIIMPLPPFCEQIRIAERIEELLDLIDKIDELQARYNADVDVLKSKIIDAGIQGKLTEQLPEDGSAEDLYNQIQKEKQKLIAEGKIKKEKSLPEIEEDEIPFEIPNKWKWVRWGEVVNVVSARRVHQSDWAKTGIPFYRAREIAKLADDGSVDNDLFISQKLFDEFSKTGVPRPGDLMVSAVGTLGKAYVVKDGDKFYYKDASVICFENYGGIEPWYLKYVMESGLMQQQINSNSGGTTVDTLTMVRMNSYLLPLPQLHEQKRIVKTISRVIQVIEENND